MRAAAQDAALRECTFAPKLVSQQMVLEGRVMKVGGGMKVGRWGGGWNWRRAQKILAEGVPVGSLVWSDPD